MTGCGMSRYSRDAGSDTQLVYRLGPHSRFPDEEKHETRRLNGVMGDWSVWWQSCVRVFKALTEADGASSHNGKVEDCSLVLSARLVLLK